MEVIDAVDRGHFSAAVIAGHLLDLRDAEIANGRVNAKREESLLIRREGDKYYWLQDKAMQMAMARMKDPADSLKGLINDRAGPDLDLPLSPGKVFGDPEAMATQKQEIQSGETHYVGWLNVVDKAGTISLKGVKGVRLPARATRYELRYLTNTSIRTMGFVHGIGITDLSFDYHPAGCLVLNTKVRLTEYHRGS
jgi:hypothetical protein